MAGGVDGTGPPTDWEAMVETNTQGLMLLIPRSGIILIVSGVVELLAWWLRQDAPIDAEQLAEILDRHVVSPNVGHLVAAGTA